MLKGWSCMFNFKKGCKVPFPEKILEEYGKTKYGYIANVSVEKTIDVLKDFVYLQDDLVFFFLELPTNLADEPEKENGMATNFHKDIYYMDYLTKEETVSFLDDVGELLANDGLCKFGFGSQSNNDEIMVGKYNVVTISCKEKNLYESLFRKNNIKRTANLVTAWNTFSKDSPGVSEKIELNGKDVYSIIDDYKDWGIYFAERRIEE